MCEGVSQSACPGLKTSKLLSIGIGYELLFAFSFILYHKLKLSWGIWWWWWVSYGQLLLRPSRGKGSRGRHLISQPKCSKRSHRSIPQVSRLQRPLLSDRGLLLFLLFTLLFTHFFSFFFSQIHFLYLYYISLLGFILNLILHCFLATYFNFYYIYCSFLFSFTKIQLPAWLNINGAILVEFGYIYMVAMCAQTMLRRDTNDIYCKTSSSKLVPTSHVSPKLSQHPNKTFNFPTHFSSCQKKMLSQSISNFNWKKIWNPIPNSLYLLQNQLKQANLDKYFYNH